MPKKKPYRTPDVRHIGTRVPKASPSGMYRTSLPEAGTYSAKHILGMSKLNVKTSPFPTESRVKLSTNKTKAHRISPKGQAKVVGYTKAMVPAGYVNDPLFSGDRNQNTVKNMKIMRDWSKPDNPKPRGGTVRLIGTSRTKRKYKKPTDIIE